MTPILHDTPGEIAQPYDVKDWKRARSNRSQARPCRNVAVVERDYPNLYKRFTALGPLMDKLGNGGKGISAGTRRLRSKHLGELNGVVTEEGPTQRHGPGSKPTSMRPKSS